MKKEVLWQSDKEWLSTGWFSQEQVATGEFGINTTTTRVAHPSQLVVMVGGVPRDIERQKNLPLINKLYGSLAIKLAERNIASLPFHQPGTGRSDGDLSEITLEKRYNTLKEITSTSASRFGVDRVSFVGMSAGSYISARTRNLVNQDGLNVDTLVLQSPAAYPKKLDKVSYGPNFKSVLDESWDITESPVYSALTDHVSANGKVHISFFERDSPPIPTPIQNIYRSWAAEQNSNASYSLIEGVAHNFRRINGAEHHSAVDNDSVRRTSSQLADIISS